MSAGEGGSNACAVSDSQQVERSVREGHLPHVIDVLRNRGIRGTQDTTSENESGKESEQIEKVRCIVELCAMSVHPK